MMDWQQHSDFLHAWPELHSLLAAYIAIEEGDEQEAISQFIAENPKAIERVAHQLTQLIQSNNPVFWSQAASLAGRAEANQAWLHSIMKMLKSEA